MKRKVKLLGAILLVATATLIVSCSSAPSSMNSTNGIALSSHQGNDYTIHSAQHEDKTAPESVASLDGLVEYCFECEIDASTVDYPVVDVSPHELTVQDAQRVGGALLGDAQFFEYVFDKPLSSEEREENIARWESYLSGGMIQDLFKGNEALIRDYELVLSRFEANYAAASDNPSGSFEMTPCEWTFRPDSVYFGEPAEKEPRTIRAVVDSEGVTYRFDVVNRTSDDFCVYMVSAYLYNAPSPNNIDTLVQQYELCKAPEPSQEQLRAIEDKAYSILSALNVGDWKIDYCHSDRLCRGDQEAYVITIRAVPVFEDFPVLRQVQLSNLILISN